MKLFHNLKSKRIFYRILLLQLAMVCVMFLMAFWFMGSYIAKSYEQRTRESAQQLLRTAGEYVDLAVVDLGRAMQQQLWNTDITGAILLPDEVSYARKVEIVKALATLEQDQPIVSRAYLITYSNQTLYDSSGNITALKDSPQRSFFPQFNAGVQSHTVGDEDFSTSVLTVDGSVALLQDFPTPEHNGALLVELHSDVLLDFLGQSLGDTHAYMEVRDSSGALIYSIGSPPGGDGQPERFVSSAGWSFQLWPDQSQGKLTTAELLQLIGLWLLIFGAVSVLTAVSITWSIYRPIRALRSAVEGDSPDLEGNELEVVQQAYENTLRQKASLSHEVAEMAPIVRDRLYKTLIRGQELPETYLLDRLAYLNSPFSPDGVFTVLVSALDESFDGNRDELMGGLYHRLSQPQHSQSHQTYSRECLLMDDYSLVVILSFQTDGLGPQIKSAQLEQEKIIQEYAKQNNAGDQLAIGHGKPCRGITNLHYSYEEALEHLNYQRYHGAQDQDGLSEEVSCRRSIQLAMGGDVDGAQRSFEVLLQELAHRPLEREARNSSWGAIMDDLIEALLNLHVPQEKLAPFERYYREMEHAPEAELEATVREVGFQGLSLLGHYGQKNRNRYVSQAQKYIQEHCSDSHLSLETVAASIGITPTYLSRLFYELCDLNFVNYVNECRVSKAKLLLTQSKIPAQEVGFRCGFNSLQNFNRVFKRHTGTTPGAFRKQ